MLAIDRDALVCDLAETYHILDYKALPPELVAVLASGLRENSRIKMKLSGSKVGPDRILLAGILDRLSIMIWMRTKDAQYGRNMPASVLDDLLGTKSKDNEIVPFNSIEELDDYYEKTFGVRIRSNHG